MSSKLFASRVNLCLNLSLAVGKIGLNVLHMETKISLIDQIDSIIFRVVTDRFTQKAHLLVGSEVTRQYKRIQLRMYNVPGLYICITILPKKTVQSYQIKS